jgi:hypothetical protein
VYRRHAGWTRQSRVYTSDIHIHRVRHRHFVQLQRDPARRSLRLFKYRHGQCNVSPASFCFHAVV